MPSQTVSLTTFSDLARSSSVATWSNPSNAQTSNDIRAGTSTVSAQGYTDYLKALGPSGLSIPTNATIVGIVVTIEKRDAQGSTSDSSVKLVVGGAIVGTEHASATAWATTDTVTTYGGASDLWGLTPTLAQINDAGFGVVISAAVTNGQATQNPGGGSLGG